MLIENSAVKRAVGSKYGRLEICPASDTKPRQEQVVCKSSFFSWTVHCLRYRISKGYQNKVHKMRSHILQELEVKTSPQTSSIISNRKAFNRLIFSQLNSPHVDTPLPDVGRNEIPPHPNQVTESTIQAETTPGAPIVSAPTQLKTSGNRKWSNQNNTYDTFWCQKEKELVESGYRNVVRFQKNGNGQKFPNITLKTGGKRTGAKILCAEVTKQSECLSQNASRIRYDENAQKTTAGCILSYLQFVTPTAGGRHDDLYGWVNLLPFGEKKTSKAIHEGLKHFGLTGVPPDGFTEASFRVPKEKLDASIKALLSKHFLDGASKEEIIEGLNKELQEAGESSQEKQSSQKSTPKLTTEELKYVVEGMKRFTTMYFEANNG